MIFIYNQQTRQIKHFLSLLKIERNLSPLTLKSYSYDLFQFIDWHKHTKQLKIHQKSVLNYFDYLQEDAHLSPRSILRKYASIRQFLLYLNEEHNVHEKFFRFHGLKFQTPVTLPKVLSLNEVKKLIQATENNCTMSPTPYQYALAFRDHLIIELLFCLGLRISEVTKLHISDYCPEETSILIHAKRSKERLLYISTPSIHEQLDLWIHTIRPILVKSASDFLFLNRFGNQLSIYAIEDIYKKYQKLSNINPLSTPHYLRHTFATHLLNNGASLRDVQEILGHKNIGTTQIYTEVSLKRKQNVFEKYNARNSLF